MYPRFSKFIATTSLCLLWLFSTGSAQAKTPIHQVSSDTCKLCHKEIYKQWSGSMHAQSSALKDPIHGAFYRQVMGDPKKEGLKSKKGTYPVCLQCHAPNAAKDKVTKLDTKPAYSEGVNCVACHTLKSLGPLKNAKGKLNLGMKRYETSTSLQGPQGFKTVFKQEDDMFGGSMDDSDSKPNPHLGKSVELDGKTIASMPMQGNSKLMRTNDACMGCHDMRPNSKKVPLCRTGNEYKTGKSNVACTSCHMPVNNGLSNHAMGGGHDNALVSSSVVFSVDSKKKGSNLKTTVTVRNRNPHSLPTGAPFRNIFMKLTAFDKNGKVLWINAKKHPREEDPKAYFNYEITDDAGKHSSPPKATKLGADNRLDAFETRKLEYNIPAKGVAVVRGELFYNLLWSEIQGKLKKKKFPKALITPQSIAFSEVKI